MIRILFLTIIIFGYSCSLEERVNPNRVNSNNESIHENNFRKITLNGNHIGKIKEKNIDELHKNVTSLFEILKKMYSDSDVPQEVNDLIFIGHYSDENVLLSDLLESDGKSWIKNSNLKFGKFKNEYYLEKNRLSRKMEYGNKIHNEFEKYLFDNGVSIYFPYSENFKGKVIKEITLVLPPKEDTQESEGIKIYWCGQNICEELVTVNDEYCQSNPTHILFAGGVYEKGKTNSYVTPREVHTVYLGAIRCKKQYDALISLLEMEVHQK